jgi:hypothetical protein
MNLFFGWLPEGREWLGAARLSGWESHRQRVRAEPGVEDPRSMITGRDSVSSCLLTWVKAVRVLTISILPLAHSSDRDGAVLFIGRPPSLDKALLSRAYLRCTGWFRPTIIHIAWARLNEVQVVVAIVQCVLHELLTVPDIAGSRRIAIYAQTAVGGGHERVNSDKPVALQP